MKKLIALSIATTIALSTAVFADEITITEVKVIPVEATEAEDAIISTISVTVEAEEATEEATETEEEAEITSDSAIEVEATLPIIDKATGELMLPAREEAEKLGYQVLWNANEKSITFTKDDEVFKTTVGSDEFLYNGKVILEAPATIIVESKSYIPGSFVNAMSPRVELPFSTESAN